jgi:hypothetical protein
MNNRWLVEIINVEKYGIGFHIFHLRCEMGLQPIENDFRGLARNAEGVSPEVIRGTPVTLSIRAAPIFILLKT